MTTSIAVYIGRRMTTKNQLAHFWQWQNDQKPRGFKKQLAPAQIGEAWTFTHTADGGYYVTGEHAPTKNPTTWVPPEQRTKFVAEDQVAEQQLAEHKARRALANRKGEFDRALEPLRKMLGTLRTHQDRSAFIKRVESELWRI